jgi:hypothetical protein
VANVACAGVGVPTGGTKAATKNKGTKTHAPLRVKAYLNLSSIFN